MRATRSLSDEKERTPIIGLAGLLLISKTGAKSTLKPKALNSLAMVNNVYEQTFESDANYFDRFDGDD